MARSFHCRRFNPNILGLTIPPGLVLSVLDGEGPGRPNLRCMRHRFLVTMTLQMVSSFAMLISMWWGSSLFPFTNEVGVILIIAVITMIIGTICILGMTTWVVIARMFRGLLLSCGLLTFYFAFEASIFPVLVMILLWGLQPERSSAFFYLMVYSVVSSYPFSVACHSMECHSVVCHSACQHPFCYFIIAGLSCL